MTEREQEQPPRDEPGQPLEAPAEARTAQARQIVQDAQVQQALAQSTGEAEAQPPIKTGQKLWIAGYLAIFLTLGVLFYLERLGYLGFAARYGQVIQRFTMGGMAISLALLISRLVDAYLICRTPDPVSRFNLTRIRILLTWLAIAFILISILFATWYTAVVSFGLVSLILGFALQTPITSFIAWIYILVRQPYRVGDRIRIGEATGDVIDVGYLDTTLWEFGGEFLSTDHPSGRLIKFPNSDVLNHQVFNYSWSLFPYIWNEVVFQIAYDSDLDYVAKVMQEVVEEELGQAMMERVGVYRELLAQTPVDHLEVRERPVVVFRINQNTWVDAIVRYVVEPREAGRVKSRLIRKLLVALRAEPERVLFPKSNLR